MKIKDLEKILANSQRASRIFAQDRECLQRLQQIYPHLTSRQRNYFDRTVRIGPRAEPHSDSGVWPEKTGIEQYIVRVWGKRSMPMMYYRLIFGGKSY